ncbi:uncharacterized protein LOC113207429 isoform X2 [Frankliniella occidentalis]|uniref:COX assembly mitochondrial protein n=1 Tax=Frankliniella occidentalis TaxID=133901 RepID=A0A6J1SKF8_FRAOC|nr:uncharacterized protein LOC113207429 isoform X2 [Frankliniella occidentalis]
MPFNIKSKIHQMIETMAREGDPDDNNLNDIEVNLILPRAYQTRLDYVVCKAETEALENCRRQYGVFMSFMCVEDLFHKNTCLLRNRNNEDVKDDCSEEYIALRSHYRLTKDPKTLRRMKAMILPKTYATVNLD